ncbi:eukaryotic translation initiation factor 4 gamma 3-like isoform X2 [Xyrauchen texanus]|uniref:eukaryotic translation initiation factor 4 gamma 3-like isoform X2 n=1 Tax=Xyrauchen texanus TaxID=154827 RepID=UPI0022419C93|nr:eukaryotic translation initiation factor 4 gamma 3-like isoform X2 [Xyrauchen texanus]
MSLPPKAVPKPSAGTGSGPSPSNQLRGPLPQVPFPPGPPVAQQPPPVPHPPIFHNITPRTSRLPLPLEERIFSTQPVAAVYSVHRTPGPYDISKGHTNLVGTPPGHASSPGLSQSPYTPGQNASTTPLVYSSPTQPMNTQPQSRPFAPGPRPTHHQGGFRPIQFFQRTQMQTVRPTIQSNNPPIRPTSQTPTAAVYPPNQPIMMTMAPMPFHSQTAQYYIQQYRHSASPYVGPPQQYPVQPTGPSTFYAGPSPGDFPAPYAGPPYYPGQTMYTPSPSIIVPTPQQPPPTKREKKTIRIRDPNQGGKDVTDEILSGVGSSRNTTPPVGRPSSTPTPPQQLNSQVADHRHIMFNVDVTQLHPAHVDLKADDKPKLEFALKRSASPGLRHSEAPLERRDPCSSVQTPSPPQKTELPPSSPELAPSVATASTPSMPASTVESAEPSSPSAEPSPTKVITPELESSEPEKSSEQPSSPSLSTSPAHSEKAINGLVDTDAAPLSEDLESHPREVSPSVPQSNSPNTEHSLITPELEAESAEVKADSPLPSVEDSAGSPDAPSLPVTTSITTAAISTTTAPPPGLTHPARRSSTGLELKEAGMETEALSDKRGELFLQSRKSSIQATSSAPKTWKKPKEDMPVSQDQCPDKEENMDRPATEPAAKSPSPPPVEVEKRPSAGTVQEENGEQEEEPLKNGAEHISETESSDSIHTPVTKEPLIKAVPQLAEKNGKRQYERDFLLGFQFMAACVQKPEGLPPISDVVLDKINQNKLRPLDPRAISRGPDFTPAFAEFGRQIPGGRGAPLLNVSMRRPPARKIITNISVNDEVQLKTAENAWKPGLKRESVIEDPESQKTHELFRKVRSILNKLTPQMFSQLMKQVTDLTIDTEERLKGVIDLVFEKAIDEPSFSVAYGNMCSCLATLKVPMMDKPNSTVNFRKLLLNRCQKEFEKDKVDDDTFERKRKELEESTSASERDRLQEELEDAKDKARRRSIGNIKFIGELFKLRMLTEAIMHDCVVKLLKNHDEESLECLCRLLTTIGKDLDFEKAKPRMNQYFNQMEKIVKERKTSSRIRFMLQDVIDLRLHNWVSRRADQGPKTIEQIHKAAKLEEQEEQRKVHQQLLSKDNKRRPVVQREETWSTVPMTKNSRTIDPTKILKFSKPTIDETIQLGPRAQLNWMKGSSGGAGAKANESDVSHPSATSLNRYSALQPTAPPASSLSSTSPDFDARRVLSSHGSSGQEHSDKPLSSDPTQSGPLSLGCGNKESPEEAMQELFRRDSNTSDTPKLPASAADQSRLERSQSRDSAPSGASPDKPALTEEEMERRSKTIIDEFLHINDYKEAMQCVEELEQPAMLYVFVRVGVDSTVERSQITRDHMGQLLYQLLQAGSLLKPQFFKGFSETLEFADDMAIDVPHIWLYLAELVTPVLREGGISMRELFSEFSKPLLPVGRAGILFSEILHLLCKHMSHRKVGSLWRDSGLSWVNVIPETEDVHSFITEHKLDFTLSDCSNPNEAASKRSLSPEELNKQLEKLLLEDLAGDEQIFDWVEANLDESEISSPPFLRALMTAVCKAAVKTEGSSCKVDTSIIQRRLPVLHKYLNSDTERQLQALYALQALILKLDQPPNLLRMFFDCLYDEDVITEDAFYKWENSKDPTEQQGKGVALKSVTAFFTWLREAEEESEDN